jgi:hypothetical protein
MSWRDISFECYSQLTYSVLVYEAGDVHLVFSLLAEAVCEIVLLYLPDHFLLSGPFLLDHLFELGRIHDEFFRASYLIITVLNDILCFSGCQKQVASLQALYGFSLGPVTIHEKHQHWDCYYDNSQERRKVYFVKNLSLLVN